MSKTFYDISTMINLVVLPSIIASNFAYVIHHRVNDWKDTNVYNNDTEKVIAEMLTKTNV